MKKVVPPDHEHRRKAIEDRDHNLLLQAGAGSGKTSTLIGRLASLLSEARADLNRIVAITFTEKAAAELKTRLRKLCDERIACARSRADREPWRRHRQAIETAPIGTIHGFCSRLLRANAFTLGLDPFFVVLDESQQKLLAGDTARQFVLERLRGGDFKMRELVGRLGLDNVVGAFTLGIEQRAKLRSDALCTSVDELVARWRVAVGQELHRELRKVQSDPQVRAAADTLRALEPMDPEDALASIRTAVLSELRVALDGEVPLTEAVAAWMAIGALEKPGNSGQAKNWPPNAKSQVAVAIRCLQSAAEPFKKWSDADDQFLLSAATLSAYFHSALPDVLAAYAWAKCEQSAIDFDDQLLLARDLLRDHPEVRLREQQRFDHVLIDEFQDTDPLQREVLWYLCEQGTGATHPNEVRLRPGRLFVVGDAKQSIYAFRGADVTIYNATRREFQANPDCLTLPLTANFRSQPRLVAFYNDLFSRPDVLGPHTDDLPDYAAFYEPLHSVRPDPEPYTDVTFQVAIGESNLPELREQAAWALAEYLRDAVASGSLRVASLNSDGGETWGPAQWRDIMILLPTMSNVAVYERALREYGVPYYVVSGRGYFLRPEIMDVVAILKVLDEPEDTISLARLLRSPAVGVSDEGLFWLTRGHSLSQGLAGEMPEMMNREDSQCARRAAELLGRLRERRHHLPIADLVQEILDAFDLPAVFATRFDGPRACANLRKIVEIARRFEAQEPRRLSAFIEYVETLRLEDAREGEAPAEEEQGNAVIVMTVHKAKGLERPVVVVADLARGGTPQRGEPVIFHDTLGPMLKGELQDGSLKFGPLADAIRADQVDREKAEDRRLLYVALTRARDRLIISTPIQMSKSGNPNRTGVWLECILNAFGDALLGGTRIQNDNGWSAEVLRADMVGRNRRRLESLLSLSADKVRALVSIGTVDAEQVQRLSSRLRCIEPDLTSTTRFTVAELAEYLECPRRYELARIRGYAPLVPLGEPLAPGVLRPQERGVVAHRALQRLGRGSIADITAEVEAAAKERGLGGHDRRDIRAIASLLQRFTQSHTWELIRESSELRSEAPVVARLAEATIEGQIDALVRDPDGNMHLIDYKTGRFEDKRPRKLHVFQVGLYAAAVEKAHGTLPATITLHYLQDNKELSVAPSSAARSATQQASEAIRGIRAAEFPPRPKCTPSRCPYSWVCGYSDSASSTHAFK